MNDLVSIATRPLATRWLGRPLVLRESTGSTNDDVREAALAGAPSGYTVVADAQSSGRGRRGRTWQSPPGANLYLSVLARPAVAPQAAPRITLATALAVCDAIDPVVGDATRVSIKWPNDVRVDRRKVAGILVEGSLRGGALAFVVVGVGLNVGGTALPEAIALTATTLRIAIGRAPDRGDLLLRFLAALETRIDALGAETVHAAALRCDTLGTRVSVDGVEGTAVRLADDGALVVRRDDGSDVEVRSGEIASGN